MMGLFKADSSVEKTADNQWRCFLSERWCVGPIPNGGYIMAVVARAMTAELEAQSGVLKDPMSINGFYMAATKTGPADIHVEVLRTGSTDFVTARLLQEGALKGQFTAAFTDLGGLKGESRLLRSPPAAPDFDACTSLPLNPLIPLTEFVDQRVVPGQERCMSGELPEDGVGRGAFQGWIDFTSPEPLDTFALMFFADAFPPPVFSHYGLTGWVPTIELTVQLRARPEAGPLRCEFTTQMLTDGLMEEDGSLWSADGQLLAISRQTAKLRLM